MMLYFGFVSQEEGMPKMKAAVMKAIELDDSLADAHMVLGGYKVHFAWDWEGGEREYKRALELNPNHLETHHNYANYYFAMR
jgi:serine/threonine-protein kinase